MESFISAASVVLSTLSISLPVSSLPTDTSSGHLNVERGTSGRYLQPFTVVYGDSSSDEPSNNIMKEINGRSNDINKGFGVNYVRIVINRTDDLDDLTIAHFSFKNEECILMYDLPHPDFKQTTFDLAKGAEGTAGC